MLRLITLRGSHYCEKARWALERAGLRFVEEPHPPFLHLRHTLPNRVGHSTPQLAGDGVALGDSTDILAWIQSRPEAAWRPYPDDPGERAEVEQLEDEFDRRLGPHTRRLVYHHILPHPALVAEAVGRSDAAWETRAFRLGYPLIRRAMARSMRIDARGAERSRARIDASFAAVSERLADGRRHLVGDRFTAADLCFAALAAPVLLPPEYGGFDGSPLVAPEPLRREIERLAATPAGRFALRLYAEERRPSSA